VGNLANSFYRDSSGITIHSVPVTREDHTYGTMLSAQIPLKYGLRLDSWWFAQTESSIIFQTIDSRAYTRLYFERNFFRAPLTIRSHISMDYYGRRNAFSNVNSAQRFLPDYTVGFRISATIGGVSVIWGTENLLNRKYSIMPGYPMIGKEEYLAFMWRLLL
jgi:hypothetical protein